MDKKTLLYTIRWAVTVAACAFLVWKLVTYDDYPALLAGLHAMGLYEWLALAFCVALMPVNMALEAWRWRTLVPMSWREAHRQVYYSKLAGLVTPWRLGEYPSRALLMDETDGPLFAQVLSMGAVGSVTMTAAIVIAGVGGIAFSPAVFDLLGGSYLYSLAAVVLALALLYLFMPRLLRRWAVVGNDLLIRSTAQSLVRLACWCVQLALVLYALNAVPLSGSRFPVSYLPVYYLLVTVTPNVPIAEAGVRGAWAMVLFGSVNAALAGVLLWAVNTLLPCAAALFLQKNKK